MSPKKLPLDLHGLVGDDDALFTLRGGRRRDEGVDAWLAGEPRELRALAAREFFRLRGCGEDVVELMHDGFPVACVGEAPFGYVATFRAHANLGFFRGALLEDPAGLLEGSGKRMRHVKLRPGRAADDAALQALVQAAYADIRARLAGQAD